jgi:hypothetical protein
MLTTNTSVQKQPQICESDSSTYSYSYVSVSEQKPHAIANAFYGPFLIKKPDIGPYRFSNSTCLHTFAPQAEEERYVFSYAPKMDAQGTRI